MSNLSIHHRILPSEVRTLAQLHTRAFPGYFLSELGTPFLEQLYRAFVSEPTSVTAIARIKGVPCGVVVGTTDPKRFFRRLLYTRGILLAAASLRAIVSKPAATPRIVSALRYRGGVPEGPGAALLSSICVAPEAQGLGVGSALLASWQERASAKGAVRAFLTTDAERNDRTLAFYEAAGWEFFDTFVTAQGRKMARYTIRSLAETSAT